MTAGESLREAASVVPNKPAVIAEDGTYTFADLDTLSESLAAGLIEGGLLPGARAIFQIGSVKEIFVALFGCFKAGIVPLCTLPQYREIEIKSLGASAGATAYFVQGDVSPSFDQIAFARSMKDALPQVQHLIITRGQAQNACSLEELAIKYDGKIAREKVRPYDPSPDDVILFQLSGGSTGLPKIIPRFHSEYLGSALALAQAYELDENDIGMWALPLIHNAGMLFTVIPTTVTRRTNVILSNFDVEKFLAAIPAHRVTFTGSIGPVAPRLIEHPRVRDFDLSSLRQFFTLSRADALEAHTGIVSGNMFGITEGLLTACGPSDPADARHRGCGRPVAAGDEIRLLKPTTEEEVALGDVGELTFRGPSTLVGYYNDPKANEACFTSDGFFRTGDLMRAFKVGEQTHYSFEGRIKDNINRGGEKIGAEELEGLIAGHPDILDARVVAMPDRIYGEKVCAYVVPKPGHTAPDVKTLGVFLLEAGLAKYKLPERVESISAFPVTRVGKVDKAAMRADIAKKLADEEAMQSAALEARRG
ncbi:AMP-binding protein [Pseudorhodoplanes sp.]|uniref:AMP-binding protein n=1 Tax=Pseudorhodoplanes sp. TaxID=1934341 RepID=UPI00391DEE18